VEVCTAEDAEKKDLSELSVLCGEGFRDNIRSKPGEIIGVYS
jgi:hypothetical protein